MGNAAHSSKGIRIVTHSYIAITKASISELHPSLSPSYVDIVHDILVSCGNQLSLMPLTGTEIQQTLALFAAAGSNVPVVTIT